MMFCGIALVEIKRIEKSLENPRFLEKNFGEREKEELEKKGNKSESIAACFAAKEAFLKVMQTGLSGFALCEIELLHKESGAPYLKFSGKAKKAIEEKGLKICVSITHTKELAQAIVIGYENEINW